MLFGYHRICYCTQSLSPGLVRTEIMDAGHLRTVRSHDIFSRNPCLDPQDIADAVLYVLGTPPHVQVITNCSFSGQNIGLSKLIIKTDQDLRWLSHCCCRRFQSPGMCYCIDRQAVPNIPRDHNDFIFSAKQSNALCHFGTLRTIHSMIQGYTLAPRNLQNILLFDAKSSVISYL